MNAKWANLGCPQHCYYKKWSTQYHCWLSLYWHVPVTPSHFLSVLRHIFTWSVPIKASLIFTWWFKPCVYFEVAEYALPKQLISGYFQGCSSEKANRLCRKLGTLVLHNHRFFFFFTWNFVDTDGTDSVLEAILENWFVYFSSIGKRRSKICSIFSSKVWFWGK